MRVSKGNHPQMALINSGSWNITIYPEKWGLIWAVLQFWKESFFDMHSQQDSTKSGTKRGPRCPKFPIAWCKRRVTPLNIKWINDDKWHAKQTQTQTYYYQKDINICICIYIYIYVCICIYKLYIHMINRNISLEYVGIWRYPIFRRKRHERILGGLRNTCLFLRPIDMDNDRHGWWYCN